MTKNCEHRDTDFGFALIREDEIGTHIELYGMTGVGRYELFESLGAGPGEDVDEAIQEALEATDENNLVVYGNTKRLLNGGAA